MLLWSPLYWNQSVIYVIMHLSDPSAVFFNTPEQEIAIHLSTRASTKQVSVSVSNSVAMPFDSSELLFFYNVLTAILTCDFNKYIVTSVSTHLASYSGRLCLWWRRCEGASHASFCLCTSPLFLLSILAGSCKDWLPHRTGLSRSGKKMPQQ